MNELQQDRLRLILNDDLLLSAVRKVFMDETELHKPVEGTEDDAVLGQKYRAYLKAKDIIVDSFSRLESYRVSHGEKSVDNRAR